MFAVLAAFFIFPYALTSIPKAIKKKLNLQVSVAYIVQTLKDRLAYDSLYNLFDTAYAHSGRFEDQTAKLIA